MFMFIMFIIELQELRRVVYGAVDPTAEAPLISLEFQDQGKISHTENHKSEIPLENATENALGNSIQNPLDK